MQLNCLLQITCLESTNTGLIGISIILDGLVLQSGDISLDRIVVYLPAKKEQQANGFDHFQKSVCHRKLRRCKRLSTDLIGN
jgi:hypothetical protein